MNFSSPFVIIFLAGTILNFLLDNFLEFIDFKNRKNNGQKIPQELEGSVKPETLAKTCLYEDAQYKLWIPENILRTLLSLVLICSGFYFWLLNFINSSITQNSFLILMLFTIFASIPGIILNLPFELYHEFVLEKKFGFSTMTFKLWILDAIKEFIVNMLLIAALFAIMSVIFNKFENSWWLFIGIAYISFSLIISIIFPLFIAPLFNKFSPLEKGELKERLEKLLQKCGFKSSGLFVMDASKRSKHSNAYFTGFGKSKRVVLFDTLIAQLTPAEIESVLGHELGHFKKHHIIKRLCAMIPVIIAMLYAAFALSRSPAVFEAFGFDFSAGNWGAVPQFAGLFLLGIIFGGYGIFFGAVNNYFSRKDEFEADAFAKDICGTGQNLATSLIKLNTENMSEISVPAIYSLFNYNHPPLLERLRALNFQAEKSINQETL